MSRVSLDELRRRIGAVNSAGSSTGAHGAAPRDFSQLAGGLPRGCLVEFSGAGKTELLATFLQEHPELHCAWIEAKLSINPFALWQRRVVLKNLLFIEAGDQALWAAHQVLQSENFELLALSQLVLADVELRKLQLLAEKSAMHLVLLSEQAHRSWAIALHINAQTKGAA